MKVEERDVIHKFTMSNSNFINMNLSIYLDSNLNVWPQSHKTIKFLIIMGRPEEIQINEDIKIYEKLSDVNNINTIKLKIKDTIIDIKL